MYPEGWVSMTTEGRRLSPHSLQEILWMRVIDYAKSLGCRTKIQEFLWDLEDLLPPTMMELLHTDRYLVLEILS
jgi:hypothetical protein